MKKTVMIVAVMAGLSMTVSATLVKEYSSSAIVGKDAAAVDLGASVAADAGDVIVFSASSSQAYVKGYSIISGDGGAVGVETSNWVDKNVSVSYFTVTAGGTFNLSVAGNAGTYDTFGAYVLGSDQAGYSVIELAQAQTYEANHLLSPTNQLNYGTLATGGIVIEGAQGNVIDSTPVGYAAVVNSGVSRAVVDGSFSAGAVSSIYLMGGDASKNSRTAGIAFTEVIPEPATMGLVVALGGALIFVRRRFIA